MPTIYDILQCNIPSALYHIINNVLHIIKLAGLLGIYSTVMYPIQMEYKGIKSLSRIALHFLYVYDLWQMGCQQYFAMWQKYFCHSLKT